MAEIIENEKVGPHSCFEYANENSKYIVPNSTACKAKGVYQSYYSYNESQKGLHYLPYTIMKETYFNALS